MDADSIKCFVGQAEDVGLCAQSLGQRRVIEEDPLQVDCPACLEVLEGAFAPVFVALYVAGHSAGEAAAAEEPPEWRQDHGPHCQCQDCETIRQGLQRWLGGVDVGEVKA